MKRRENTDSCSVVEAKYLFTKQRYHTVTHDSGSGYSCSIVEVRYRFTAIEAAYTHPDLGKKR